MAHAPGSGKRQTSTMPGCHDREILDDALAEEILLLGEVMVAALEHDGHFFDEEVSRALGLGGLSRPTNRPGGPLAGRGAVD